MAHLPAVSLDELESVAPLQTRRDRKYLVPALELAAILAMIPGDVRALEIAGRRTFRYQSVYFDTPQLALYLMTAHGRPRRAKVRSRAYLDSGETFLEVKVRDGRGRTVKHRHPFVGSDRWQLGPEAQRLAAGVLGHVVDGRMSPTLVTSFERTSLLLTDGSRATIDRALRVEAPGGATIELPGTVILETKSRSMPTCLDRLLWATHHRPLRFSKYGTGLAALDDRLPANRWHRVLSRLNVSPAMTDGDPDTGFSRRPILRRSAQDGVARHALP